MSLEGLKHLKANCGLIAVCVKQSRTQSLMYRNVMLSWFRFLVTGFFFDYFPLHQIDQDIHRKYTLSSDAELILIRSLTLGKVISKSSHHVKLSQRKGRINRMHQFLQSLPPHSSLHTLMGVKSLLCAQRCRPTWREVKPVNIHAWINNAWKAFSIHPFQPCIDMPSYFTFTAILRVTTLTCNFLAFSIIGELFMPSHSVNFLKKKKCFSGTVQVVFPLELPWWCVWSCFLTAHLPCNISSQSTDHIVQDISTSGWLDLFLMNSTANDYLLTCKQIA